MIKSIRNIKNALSGDGEKKLSKSESKNVSVVRKSIHLKKDLSRGYVITEEDIIVLRLGSYISKMEWNNIIGYKLLENKSKFDKLTYSNSNYIITIYRYRLDIRKHKNFKIA